MPDIRSIEPLRRRICSIIDIGTADDFISRAYDIFYTLVILVNLAVTIAYTFDGAEAAAAGCCWTLRPLRWPFLRRTAPAYLDISRQTVIVMIRRRGRMLIPRGSLVLLEGDQVIFYSQSHLPHGQDISI